MTTILNHLPYGTEMKIFPILPSDVQKLIISFCDAKSLVRFGGVAKEVFGLLTNEVFNKIYKDLHPALNSYDKLFSNLRSIHPSNCWKVICQVMDPSWKGYNGSIAKSLNPSFLQEAISHTASLKSQREATAVKLKEICGSYHQDPNSQIHQAWHEANKNHQEIDSLVHQLREIVRQMNNLIASKPHIQFTETQVQSIIADVKGGLNESNSIIKRFLSMSYEEFVKQTELGRNGMSTEHFNLHQEYAKLTLSLNQISQELNIKREQGYTSREKYECLEGERKRLESEIKCVNPYIQFFDSNPENAHISHLTSQWATAHAIKETIQTKPHLEKCKTLVQTLLTDPTLSTPETLGAIRNLINACADKSRIAIWGDLYFKCAGGVEEDSWAENHFQQHLPQLHLIILEELSDVRQKIADADRHYNSSNSSAIPR